MKGFMDGYRLPQVEVRLYLREAPALYSTKALKDCDTAVEVMRDELKEMSRECMMVVNLDNNLRPINYVVAATGTINMTACYVREIFKSAILSNAFAVIMFHNHPSGDPEPSEADFDTTQKVVEAGKLLGIPVHDHIVAAGISGEIYSIRSEHPELFG